MPLAAKMTVANVSKSGGGTNLPACVAQRTLDAWPPANWEEDPDVQTQGGGYSGYYGHETEEGGCCHNEYGIISVRVPGQGMENVKLTAVATGDPNDPNHEWAIATPSGTLEMDIANPEAWGFFEPGMEYIIKITKHQPTKVRSDGSTSEQG